MRLIDADELFQEFECSAWYNNADRDEVAEELLLTAPTISPDSLRPKGRWVDRYKGEYDNPLFECSECKETALYKYEMDVLGHTRIVQALTDTCPNCGADMREEG